MNKTQVWKIVGLVIALATLIAVFLLGPELGRQPEPSSEVRTPSMQNVPAVGAKQLSIEVKPDSQGDEAEE